LKTHSKFKSKKMKRAGILYGGAKATFTFEFSGTLDALAKSGGKARSKVDYTTSKGTHYHCDSGLLDWEATRDPQPMQSTPLSEGLYEGRIGPSPAAGGRLRFTLANGATAITKIDGESLGEECISPKSSATIAVQLRPSKSIAVHDGAFAETVSEDITYNAVPAVAVYTFEGHFHGTNSAKEARAAGRARVEVSYQSNNEEFRCDSNELSWRVPVP
jgi:hypothetical protein